MTLPRWPAWTPPQRGRWPARRRPRPARPGRRAGPAGRAPAATRAAPGQHDGHAPAAARFARAVIDWDRGQVSDSLELLREAARHGGGISPDARHPQPLLALAAAL